jgi:hypothetical protein
MTTTLTAAPAVSVRPVRWPRLGWVAWRRYRFTLAGSVLVVGVLALLLLHSGNEMRAAYHALQACTPATSEKCRFMDQNFHNNYGNGGFLGPILLLLPGILGVAAGAPLLARELETGTFRYAWTQGVGRMRWAISLLVPGAVIVAVLAGAFGALVLWHQQPLVDYGSNGRLDSSTFSATGIAAAAWALGGFALGALAGVLWHRVLPAVATASAAWFGLAYLAAVTLRNHYLAPLHTSSLRLSGRDLVISQYWTYHGQRVSDDQIDQALQGTGAHVSEHRVTVHAVGGGGDPIQDLLKHGYRQISVYQPAGRYWSFQWIEAGWLTLLSVALIAASVWLLRRRAA